MNAFALISIYLTMADGSSDPALIPALFSLVVMFLSALLTYGFLRTVALDPFTPQPPSELFKTGRSFFLRITCLKILFSLILFAIGQILAKPVSGIMPPELGHKAITLITKLLLIKLFIFSHAAIFTRDCMLSAALGTAKHFDIKKIAPTAALYILSSLLIFITPILDQQALSSKILISRFIIVSFISQVLETIVFISAIRFVAKEDLGYDSKPEMEMDEEIV